MAVRETTLVIAGSRCARVGDRFQPLWAEGWKGSCFQPLRAEKRSREAVHTLTIGFITAFPARPPEIPHQDRFKRIAEASMVPFVRGWQAGPRPAAFLRRPRSFVGITFHQTTLLCSGRAFSRRWRALGHGRGYADDRNAEVAELVDARDLKSLDQQVMRVRFPPSAPYQSISYSALRELSRGPGSAELLMSRCSVRRRSSSRQRRMCGNMASSHGSRSFRLEAKRSFRL